MNFLAHFHLAWPDEGLIAGGLEGDYLKGPLRGELPPELERGIKLHRAIDAYTDKHDLVRQLRAPRGEDGATTPAAADAGADAARDPAPIPPARAGATVGAFQRQSRLARLAADGEPNREEGER